MERQWSLADHFVHVLNLVREIDADVDNDNQHRYPLRKMRMTAEKILHDALGSAREVAETAEVLKREIEELDARRQP